MAQNTIKTRIQLKNDTEANWVKAVNFRPLRGEVIIYLPDDTHHFFRLKVGDGIATVNDLPFLGSEIDLNNFIPSRLAHSLTFGAGQQFIFDGSEDVTVPVYLGQIF